MSPNPLLGTTVALTRCPAHADDGRAVELSGLFDVEDCGANERGGPWYFVVRHGTPVACVNVEHDRLDCSHLPKDARCEHCAAAWYSIEADALVAQAKPGAYGEDVAADRELGLAAEDHYGREELEPGVYLRKEQDVPA